jgi:hypothetical protein
MPFFTTVKEKNVQLCVFTGRGEDCTRKDCEFSHEPKERRVCRFFHTPGILCKDDTNCLLGHQEAKAAARQQKAFRSVTKTNNFTDTPNGAGNQAGTRATADDAGACAGAGAGAATTNGAAGVPDGGTGVGGLISSGTGPATLQDQNQTLLSPANPPLPALNSLNPAPNPTLNHSQNPVADVTQAITPQPNGQGTGQNTPPIHFQSLAQQNVTADQEDEIKPLTQQQAEMMQTFESFKKQFAEKEIEVRHLQTAMGEMTDTNERLRTKNESKTTRQSVSLLDRYYSDVLENSSGTRSLLNLNDSPPSETALEGALVILKTMYARPLEFAGNTKTIDLVLSRPETRFSKDVAHLTSIGLNLTHPEHQFFHECYMKYSADPSFCVDGVLDSNSSVVSLPTGGAFPPRASVLKQVPRKFRKMFLSRKAAGQVSSIQNSALNLNEGGGLLLSDDLPPVLHTLLCKFVHSNAFKNPAVPLVSQFLTYLQNGLTSLDEILLKYTSPVYNQCPLRVRLFKNGKKEILKNTLHPAYDKWDSLIKRTQFDDPYATTRIAFSWKGFYHPKAKVVNLRDKYAFFAFAYATDLFLGALPLWPLDMSFQFQLDRKDPMRHYTIDNIRWLNRSDNMANRPSHGREKGTCFKSTKDVVRLLHSCERANIVMTEMLGALTKGYGS